MFLGGIYGACLPHDPNSKKEWIEDSYYSIFKSKLDNCFGQYFFKFVFIKINHCKGKVFNQAFGISGMFRKPVDNINNFKG